jgi:hypothetical protein
MTRSKLSLFPRAISSGLNAPAAQPGTAALPVHSNQPTECTVMAYRSRRAQDEPLLEREAALQAAVEAQPATMRDLTQRLDGTQSAQATFLHKAGAPPPVSPRKRGQQPGRPGHGRRAGAPRPVVDAVRDLRPEETRGPVCGQACRPLPAPAASPIIAVQVQAYVRHIQRQRCVHRSGDVNTPETALSVSCACPIRSRDRCGQQAHAILWRT